MIISKEFGKIASTPSPTTNLKGEQSTSLDNNVITTWLCVLRSIDMIAFIMRDCDKIQPMRLN